MSIATKRQGFVVLCVSVSVSLWGLVQGEGLSAPIGVCVWAR